METLARISSQGPKHKGFIIISNREQKQVFTFHRGCLQLNVRFLDSFHCNSNLETNRIKQKTNAKCSFKALYLNYEENLF